MRKSGLLFLFNLVLCSKLFCQIDADVVIGAFYQKGQDNCASIALIKASLNKYGFTAFKIDTIGKEYKVTLKNGDIVTIDDDKIIQAADVASFKYPEGATVTLQKQVIKKYAEVMFCVMAAYKWKIDTNTSFKEALDILGQGAYTPTVYRYLGLRPNINVIEMRDLARVKKKCALVVWSAHHAVFSCNGYVDDYGAKSPLTIRYHGRFQLI